MPTCADAAEEKTNVTKTTDTKYEIHFTFKCMQKLLTQNRSSQTEVDLGDSRLKCLHIGNETVLLDSFLNITDIFIGASDIDISEIAKNRFVRLYHPDNGRDFRRSFLALIKFGQLLTGRFLCVSKILYIGGRNFHHIAQQQFGLLQKIDR